MCGSSLARNRRLDRILLAELGNPSQRLDSEGGSGARDRDFSDPFDLRHAAIERRNQLVQLAERLRAIEGCGRPLGHRCHRGPW
jgi:hypothetical protein